MVERTPMEVFADRTDAGRRLAARLRDEPAVAAAQRVVVLAIPRGGLPVGAEVARALDAPLDVAVVRKLRSPANPELGYGAIDADGHVELDEDMIERLGITRQEIDAEIADRRERVRQRLELYRAATSRTDMTGGCVLVVDDGIATGGTARHACAFASRAGADRVVVGVPVGPADAERRLADVADDVVVLVHPAEFLSVSQGYEDFSVLDDDTAVAAVTMSVADG
jgi:putative phosphoribosyl transferase